MFRKKMCVSRYIHRMWRNSFNNSEALIVLPKVQRGSDKKGSLHIKLERAALLHIRDFECDVATLANAKRDSARNSRSAAFDYVSCVKLKYEKIRMKNTTFVVKGEANKNQCRPIFIVTTHGTTGKCISSFLHLYHVNRSEIFHQVRQGVRANSYFAVEHILHHESVQRT